MELFINLPLGNFLEWFLIVRGLLVFFLVLLVLGLFVFLFIHSSKSIYRIYIYFIINI